MHGVLVNSLVWACPGSLVRLTESLNMTIAVDWDVNVVKPQTKQTKTIGISNVLSMKQTQKLFKSKLLL